MRLSHVFSVLKSFAILHCLHWLARCCHGNVMTSSSSELCMTSETEKAGLELHVTAIPGHVTECQLPSVKLNNNQTEVQSANNEMIHDWVVQIGDVIAVLPPPVSDDVNVTLSTTYLVIHSSVKQSERCTVVINVIRDISIYLKSVTGDMTKENSIMTCNIGSIVTFVNVKFKATHTGGSASIHDKIDLIRSLARYSNLPILSFSLMPEQSTDDASVVVASGEGNVLSSNEMTLLTVNWVVGCGRVREDMMELLLRLERDARDGKLAAATGHDVIAWEVTNTKPASLSSSSPKTRSLRSSSSDWDAQDYEDAIEEVTRGRKQQHQQQRGGGGRQGSGKKKGRHSKKKNKRPSPSPPPTLVDESESSGYYEDISRLLIDLHIPHPSTSRDTDQPITDDYTYVPPEIEIAGKQHDNEIFVSLPVTESSTATITTAAELSTHSTTISRHQSRSTTTTEISSTTSLKTTTLSPSTTQQSLTTSTTDTYPDFNDISTTTFKSTLLSTPISTIAKQTPVVIYTTRAYVPVTRPIPVTRRTPVTRPLPVTLPSTTPVTSPLTSPSTTTTLQTTVTSTTVTRMPVTRTPVTQTPVTRTPVTPRRRPPPTTQFATHSQPIIDDVILESTTPVDVTTVRTTKQKPTRRQWVRTTTEPSTTTTQLSTTTLPTTTTPPPSTTTVTTTTTSTTTTRPTRPPTTRKLTSPTTTLRTTTTTLPTTTTVPTTKSTTTTTATTNPSTRATRFIFSRTRTTTPPTTSTTTTTSTVPATTTTTTRATITQSTTIPTTTTTISTAPTTTTTLSTVTTTRPTTRATSTTTQKTTFTTTTPTATSTRTVTTTSTTIVPTTISTTTTVQSTARTTISTTLPSTTLSTTRATTATTIPSATTTTAPPIDYDAAPQNGRLISHITLQAGYAARYTLPERTFIDAEDGDTRQLTVRLLTHDYTVLPPSFWLQFDSLSQQLYGLPLPDHAGTYSLRLVATDSVGQSAEQNIIIQVVNSRSTVSRLTAEFSAKIDLNFEIFANDVKKQLDVINRLATGVFGDADASQMLVLRTRRGSTEIVWSNASLATARCDADHIRALQSRLTDEETDSGFSDRLVLAFQPYNIIQVTSTPLGTCTKDPKIQRDLTLVLVNEDLHDHNLQNTRRYRTSTRSPSTRRHHTSPPMTSSIRRYTMTSLPAQTAVTNSPPVLIRRLKTLQAREGHVLNVSLPVNMFYDPEDGQNLHLTLSFPGGRPLGPSSWVYLDSERQALYGLPFSSHVGTHKMLLTARDSGNKLAYDDFVIDVTSGGASVQQVTVEFRVTFDDVGHHVASDVRHQVALVHALATRVYGDVDTGAVTVLRIAQLSSGSVQLSWTNNSFTDPLCPHSGVTALTSRLFSVHHIISPTLTQALTPYQVREVRFIPHRGCTAAGISEVTLTAGEEPEVTSNESSPVLHALLSHIDTYLFVYILPSFAAIIAILLLIVIACYCRRRSPDERNEKEEGLGLTARRPTFLRNGAPVIFADELDEQPESPQRPLLVPDERPPLHAGGMTGGPLPPIHGHMRSLAGSLASSPDSQSCMQLTSPTGSANGAHSMTSLSMNRHHVTPPPTYRRPMTLPRRY